MPQQKPQQAATLEQGAWQGWKGPTHRMETFKPQYTAIRTPHSPNPSFPKPPLQAGGRRPAVSVRRTGPNHCRAGPHARTGSESYPSWIRLGSEDSATRHRPGVRVIRGSEDPTRIRLGSEFGRLGGDSDHDSDASDRPGPSAADAILRNGSQRFAISRAGTEPRDAPRRPSLSASAPREGLGGSTLAPGSRPGESEPQRSVNAAQPSGLTRIRSPTQSPTPLLAIWPVPEWNCRRRDLAPASALPVALSNSEAGPPGRARAACLRDAAVPVLTAERP